MRICIEKVTGKLIEAQSGGETHSSPKIDNKKYAQMNLETLLQNAINMGYKEKDIEVKFVTNEEYQVIVGAQPEPVLTEKQINEKKIRNRIRELAIESLKAESKLPTDYK